nr:DUF459 domain-containing protein [Sphingomonas vulcanisoli]
MRFLLDRTAILFLGIAAGVAIGYAFGTGNEQKQAVVLAPEAAPIQAAGPAVAPPPPTAPAAADAKPEALATQPKTEAPIIDEQPRPALVEGVKNGRAIRVGVFGDSFGDGVWSALYRLLPASAGFQVTKFSQASTGFTRYRSLNLEEHDSAQIADAPIDIAVISFGANDAQGVCDGGHCGALMSAYWQKVISARVESYVAMLRRHGAAIYWVGLPVMRDTGFDSDARAMNSFYKALMDRLGVPFVDVRPLTTAGSGGYEAYYQDADGSQKLLRANDGIHMSMNGYLHISRGLAARIRSSVSEAKVQPAPSPAAFDNSTAAPDPDNSQ